MVLEEGRMSPQAIAEFRRRVGTKLRIHTFNEMASREAIRNFANGIGDTNPLWRDAACAAKTRYGSIIAPPAWLYSIYPSFVQQGLPGVHAFHSGNDWEFFRPVMVGDKIQPQATFTGFDEKSSEFAGKMIMEYQLAEFFNQRDEPIARAKTWLVRTERSAAKKTGKYEKITLPHPWKEEELKEIDKAVLGAEVRGAKTRFWEDVKVGDEVGPLVKGPLGLTDEIAFFAGCIPMMAHRCSLEEYNKHPSWAFRDPDTFSWEPIAAVHWNRHAAKGAGLPYIYDIGVQRNSWLLQLFTDWMGDDGWLKTSYCEYRKFVYFSDAVWLRGKVTKKYVDDRGEYCVDIETTGLNQRKEDTIPGRGTVILPSREAKTWPVALRVAKPG